MLRKWKEWFGTNHRVTIPFKQRRVIIFALGRSGSTLLEDLLQSTGYFKAHGELLHPSEPIQEKPLHYFLEMADKCRDAHFICHVKLYEMQSVDLAGISKREFLEGLLQNGWQIIYLTRTNKLKHFLSTHRAHESYLFHTKTLLPIVSTPIDSARFAHGINHLINWDAEEKEILQNLPFLEIQYERHLENGLSHLSTVKMILDYLNLPHRSAHTKYKKVIRGTLESVISNFDEFREVMIRSGYEKYLD